MPVDPVKECEEKNKQIVLVPDGTIMFWRRIVDEETGEGRGFETVWLEQSEETGLWQGRGQVTGDWYLQMSWYRQKAVEKYAEGAENAAQREMAERADLAASVVQAIESRRPAARFERFLRGLHWKWKLRKYRRRAKRFATTSGEGDERDS